jgi:hypothetical protein
VIDCNLTAAQVSEIAGIDLVNADALVRGKLATWHRSASEAECIPSALNRADIAQH